MTKPVVTDVELPITRVFVDDEGVEWEAVEVDATHVPAAPKERCLIFRSTGAIRRVWNYPNSWTAMSAAELVRLSWSR
jgi:hypothetical protein